MSDMQSFALPKGITAIVGGGGKTSLMTRLSLFYAGLGARVIITTSTHIMKPDFCELLISPTISQIREALRSSPLIAVGSYTDEGKLTSCDIPWQTLAELCEHVIVEADGSKRRPLKAPAAHEPVLPEGTALTIALAGMDGAEGQIADKAHRPELYARLVGKSVTDTATPQDIARVLTSDAGQRKNVRSRFAVVLNKCDTPKRLDCAKRTAELVEDEVFITALNAENAILEHRKGTRI